jgi:hypothetical protein
MPLPWNDGMMVKILEIKVEEKYCNCKKLLQTHYSIPPLFHYSNLGKAPKLLTVYPILTFFQCFKDSENTLFSELKETAFALFHHSEQTNLIFLQRSDGVFLLEIH